MALAPPRDVLVRTPIYRMVHVDCLDTLLRRGALHAPSCVPADGLPYTGIHAAQTQLDRGNSPVPCGPGGVIRDYIGFYLGPRSPMLYRIHTGHNVQHVPQSEILYLCSTAQSIEAAGLGFVFTDRHSLARVANFWDSIADLRRVDFPTAYAEWWGTTPDHPDRPEKKQAEFLVHQTMAWELIAWIGVLNSDCVARVQGILDGHPGRRQPQVLVRPSWYYS